MEYRLVTQAGYPFHHIEITGFQRKLSLNNIKRNIITLWNLALSGPKAKKMMKDIQPDLVIGCGGYVARWCAAPPDRASRPPCMSRTPFPA